MLNKIYLLKVPICLSVYSLLCAYMFLTQLGLSYEIYSLQCQLDALDHFVVSLCSQQQPFLNNNGWIFYLLIRYF